MKASWLIVLLFVLNTSYAYDVYEAADTQIEDTELELIEPKPFDRTEQLKLRIKERIYNPANGENTPWTHVPTKTISFPIAKIQYETVQFATSLFVESVTRSPLHNGLGTLDEAKKTLKLIKNGLFDMLRGILNPTNGAFFDGLFGVTSGVLNTARVAGGVIKTGASIVGYPTYRTFGGNKSERAAIRGKRAAIIQIDTGFYPMDVILDPYGDQIIRHHLNGVVDYYCVTSEIEGNVKECIEKIPYDVEYVDFVALTHSGGTWRNENALEMAVNKGFTPGMILSIGCYDVDSSKVSYKDTMGQEGTSWAVHYYLSHAIAKRLRGIPMNVAAKEAFIEGLPINFINPVSIAGQIGVGLMGDSIMGSYPDVRDSDDSHVEQTIETLALKANVIRVMRYANLYNEGKISKTEFGKLIDLYDLNKENLLVQINRFSLNAKSNFSELIDTVKNTRFPVKTKYMKRRIGGKGRRVAYKYI